jgi:hypothetical protein
MPFLCWQASNGNGFNGRTEGCRSRIHAPRVAPVGRWSHDVGSTLKVSPRRLPRASLISRHAVGVPKGHATPSSGSSSYCARIILRRQIVPCSAYSAEQSSHDCSVRRVTSTPRSGMSKAMPAPSLFASGYDLGVVIFASSHRVMTRERIDR